MRETVNSAVPLRLLRLFDRSEPLFEQPGWHPMVISGRVVVLVGRPYWIKAQHREAYQGKQAKTVVADLVNTCRDEISKLLYSGSQLCVIRIPCRGTRTCAPTHVPHPIENGYIQVFVSVRFP